MNTHSINTCETTHEKNNNTESQIHIHQEA